MKSQPVNTNQSTGTAGILRRSVLKLLFSACAVLGTFGAPSQVTAQTVNPGTGVLPPDAPELVLRGSAKKKQTYMTNLTPPFVIKNGQTVTLQAQLSYRELTTGRIKPLSYKSVPVAFRIGSIWMGSAMTDTNGIARVTVRIFDPSRILPRGKIVNWSAMFSGDVELNRVSANSRFQIMP